MWDKTFVILIVVMILTGVIGYERYMLDNGELGPISQIVNLSGLAKKEDPLNKTTVTTNRYEYQFNLEENLKRLREKHQKLQEKRAELLAKRESAIDNFLLIMDNLEEEAETFQNILKDDRRRLSEKFPLIDEIKATLLDIAAEEDEQIRNHRFEDEVREKLIPLLRELINDDQRAASAVSRLEIAVIKDGGDVIRANLQTDCTTEEECVKDHVEIIQNQIKYAFDEFVKNPESDIEEVMSLIEVLKSEYEFLRTNASATEEVLNDSEGNLDSHMAKIVGDITSVTDETLLQYFQLVKDYQQEQMILVENMQQHRKHLYERQKSLMDRMNMRISQIHSINPQNARNLSTTYQVLSQRQRDLTINFENNEQKVRETFDTKRSENSEFVNQIDQDLQLGFDRFKETLTDSQNKTKELDQKMKAEMDRKKSIAEQQRQALERKEENTKRELDRLRKKANDQGF